MSQKENLSMELDPKRKVRIVAGTIPVVEQMLNDLYDHYTFPQVIYLAVGDHLEAAALGVLSTEIEKAQRRAVVVPGLFPGNQRH